MTFLSLFSKNPDSPTYWEALNFNDGNEIFGKEWKMEESYGTGNCRLVDTQLQVTYPEGSSNPGEDIVGGYGGYANPISLENANKVFLEYKVLFPKGFDWVRGGKLPGLYGGKKGCSGGDDANDCFSTRMMWRVEGRGEMYMYVDKTSQVEDFCSEGCIPNETYGYSFGRGNFVFKPGKWTTVTQVLVLNSEGSNGSVQVYIDGILSISVSSVNFKSKALGIAFETFFGGHGEKFATPIEQVSYFKGFRLGYV